MLYEINGSNIGFSYQNNLKETAVLKDINIKIKPGEFIVLLGQNGCGKSTLVKHFNCLLPLQEGSLEVAGLDAGNEEHIWKLRRICGMVFQNPDNQFVSSVIEDDIAFGLENYQVPRGQIKEKVKKALEMVGMEGFEKRSPHELSGGQKQKIALAGVLALEPELLVFDEVTAMLDPESRREVLETLNQLHKEQRTIVSITHYAEEALMADRIYVMQEGRITAEGTPKEILTDRELLTRAGIIPPTVVRLYYDLKKAGISLKSCPLTEAELVEELSNVH